MSDVIREPLLYIGGEWVRANSSELEVEDPAEERVVGVVTQASASDVTEAISAAKGAFPKWSGISVADRVAFLRRLQLLLTERADLLAEIVNKEQGSPLALARKLHVDVPLSVLDATIDALGSYQFKSQIGNSLIFREPIGVVAAITPWNLPLHQIVTKVIPALAAGATVVLKPASLTPLVAYELARAIDEAGLLPGAFNLVPGSGSIVGEIMTHSPDVDLVSFTGSTAVGRQVSMAAAPSVKKVTLELGGKSASVVLADVSDQLLEKAVKITVANCYLNAGQTCTALSRLIVPSSRLDQVEEIAAAAVAKYLPGDRLGPQISAEQRKDVLSFLEPDSTGGAKALHNDQLPLPERGYYVPPAVFSRVPPDSRIAKEEIFGPVLSIFSADSDVHAVELANDTIYGLAGAVWSDSQEHAIEVAGQIRTGQIDINGGQFNPAAPFGGFKQSGIGREIGKYGIEDVLELKSVQI